MGPSGFGSSGFGFGFGSSGFGSSGFGFGSGSWARELWFWILFRLWIFGLGPLALDLWIWIFGVGFLTRGLWFGVQAGAMGLEGLGGGLGGTPTCIMMQIVMNLCFCLSTNMYVVPMWRRISGAIGWRWGEGGGVSRKMDLDRTLVVSSLTRKTIASPSFVFAFRRWLNVSELHNQKLRTALAPISLSELDEKLNSKTPRKELRCPWKSKALTM